MVGVCVVTTPIPEVLAYFLTPRCSQPAWELQLGPLRHISKDFGITEGCLHRWLKIADREDAISTGGKSTNSDESAELPPATTPRQIGDIP